ncbi:MAG TPA: hypothetical protein VHG08_08430 [Longimicrobium sp.]|nr:hypothetical protein [Longimicrobium sp.]
MTAIDAHPSAPRALPRGMILARRIVHWSLLPWMMLAMVAPMALAADNPRQGEAFMYGVWSYGPLAMVCSLAARMLWPRGYPRAAVAAIAIPLAILTAFVLLMVVGTLMEYGLR